MIKKRQFFTPAGYNILLWRDFFGFTEERPKARVRKKKEETLSYALPSFSESQ